MSIEDPNSPEGKAATVKLTEDYAASGPPKDQDMKNQIIMEHQWLVIVIARKMQRRQESIEDLTSVCNIGLLEALDRFDPEKGSFRTFAASTMTGVLRKHYRSSWRVHVPRSVQELSLRLSQVRDTLTSELRQPPTYLELAERAGVSLEDVVIAMDASANFYPLSLSYDKKLDIPSDHLKDVNAIDSTLDLNNLLATLPELKRKIMYLYFVEHRSQTEIADILGITQVAVSRLMRTAVVHLKAVAEHQQRIIDNE